MPCPRCGGFVVVDRSYAHLHGATTDRPMRCVNCGNYEDAVIGESTPLSGAAALRQSRRFTRWRGAHALVKRDDGGPGK